MSYQLVRLSALSGKETGYSLLGTDLVYSTLGTGVDSLSSIKVTLTELGQYISDTRVFWNSGGATDKVYPKSLSSKLGIGTDSPVVSLDVTGTDAIVIPVGSTGQRPTAETGMIRYNSTNTQFEGYGASSWQGLGGVIDVDQDTKIQAEESADEDKLRFDTAGSQRMVIDATGKVGISMEPAASSSQLTVVGSISAQGAIYATDDITAYSSSDERLKKGLAVISNPLYSR